MCVCVLYCACVCDMLYSQRGSLHLDGWKIMQSFEKVLNWTQKQLKKWTMVTQWKALAARIKDNDQGIVLEIKPLEPKTNFIMLPKLGA